MLGTARYQEIAGLLQLCWLSCRLLHFRSTSGLALRGPGDGVHDEFAGLLQPRQHDCRVVVLRDLQLHLLRAVQGLGQHLEVALLHVAQASQPRLQVQRGAMSCECRGSQGSGFMLAAEWKVQVLRGE